MKQKLFLITYIAFLSNVLVAQDQDQNTKKLLIEGYVQAQYQKFFVSDTVGGYTKYLADFSGGKFVNRFTTNRFTVRRGRLNIKHIGENHKAVFSIDISERGIGIKDLYLDYTEPFINSITFTAGVFNRPFGPRNRFVFVC